MICAACVLPVWGKTAYAAGPIDVNRDITLELQYIHDGNPVPGVTFSVYQVANVDMYAKMSLTPDFASYPISFSGIDQDGWKSLALTLAGYVQRDQIPEMDKGETDMAGELKFPTAGHSLKAGLYLLIGSAKTMNHQVLTVAPFLVFLPAQNLTDNMWDYDVSVSLKYEFQEEVISRRVIKIWDDAGCEQKRPAEVIVELFKDQTLYDTVRLNKDNNWRYTWRNLPSRYTWTVAERAVPGYKTKIELKDDTFTITNFCRPPAPTPKPPGMPPTGQLWWPVPVLAVTGGFLVVIGLIKKKRIDGDDL